MSEAAILQIETAFPDERSGAIPFGEFAGAFYPQKLPHAVASLNSWRDVSLETLKLSNERDIGGLFALLEPDMWRRYLPAWMTMVLRHGTEAEAVMASLFVTLDPQASAGMYSDDKFTPRTQDLTPPQTQAIRDFAAVVARRLEFAEAAGYDVGERLLGYWEERARAYPSSPEDGA
jgi:hypothetical protein